MDYNRLIEVLIASIFGGGGTVALLNFLRGKKSKKKGMSGNEKVAASQTTRPVGGLSTPDWEALTRHWQAELKLTREEFRKFRDASDKRHRGDESRINQLEAWIWERKEPPPPPDPREKQ